MTAAESLIRRSILSDKAVTAEYDRDLAEALGRICEGREGLSFWRDDRIREELGMDQEEVNRLKQITGLAELFADRDFSEAWEPASP